MESNDTKAIKSVIIEDFHGENYKIVKRHFKKGKKYDGFKKLPLFVVYESPQDFKDKYVVRLWEINRSIGITEATKYCVVKDTLEEARKAIPQTATFHLGKDCCKVPEVIEAWI